MGDPAHASFKKLAGKQNQKALNCMLTGILAKLLMLFYIDALDSPAVEKPWPTKNILPNA